MPERPAHLNVEALHGRLCARMAELRPLLVVDVMRVFLEVVALPCRWRLGWLEFAFDEDEGRIARVEAGFTERGSLALAEGPRLEVELELPRFIPPQATTAGELAAAQVLTMATEDGSLVSRFVHALNDLGAYRSIERVVALRADAYLL